MQNYDNLTPDMEHYIRLVQRGEFYPYLKQLLTFYQLPYTDSSFKGEFFAKIFYSKEKVFGVWRSLFHLHFPGVSEAILKAKQVKLGEKKASKSGRMLTVGGKPEILSNYLSLLESDIMIQGVAKTLYANGIYEFLTIHDAILVPKELVDIAYNTMLTEYKNKGINPTIKIEEIK
jgi:hypothetical protein